MRKVYAQSMVEGAPYGNKNAAGPHKLLHVTKVSIHSLGQPGSNWVPSTRKIVKFTRSSKINPTAKHSRTYKKVTPTSYDRLNRVLIRGHVKGGGNQNIYSPSYDMLDTTRTYKVKQTK
jgi:hypothetical protein